MRPRKRPPIFLFLSILFLVLLLLLIFFFSPVWKFKIGFAYLRAELEILYPFFALLFLVLFCTFSYIFNSKKHGLLIGLFVISWLLLRINSLTHPFFLLLLLGLFLMFELLFSYKK